MLHISAPRELAQERQRNGNDIADSVTGMSLSVSWAKRLEGISIE
jgi:hypothetical protein